MFDDIDLSGEPDWVGYDEKANRAVGVYEFKSEIATAVDARYRYSPRASPKARINGNSTFSFAPKEQLKSQPAKFR